MYAEIVGAMQSAKALSDLLKAAKSLSNYNELTLAVSDVNTRLMAASAVALEGQEKQSELLGKVAALESELREVKTFESQIARYGLVEFPATGALAYALKPDMDGGEPMHHVCAACADKREFSRLQPVNNRRFLTCPRCKSNIQVDMVPTPQIRRSAPPQGGWMSR